MLVRRRLANGLRVVLAPVPDVSAVGITVGYDVGYRTETVSGLAHLFEHLMFAADGEFSATVQGNGGICNATTQRDHTSYYSVLPVAALGLGLRLEAARMRDLRPTAAALATQVRVVGEEIARNVHNRPFGGFPWVDLPRTLFADFARTHNGYGDVDGLRRVTLDECARFADAHYGPDSAVLTIAGPIDAVQVMADVHALFGDLAPRREVEPPRADEVRAEPGEVVRPDALARTSALALGWHAPPPTGPDYAAWVVLAALLGGGVGSLLERLLVRERQAAAQVSASAALTGKPWEVRDGELFTVMTVLRPDADPDDVVDGVRAAIAGLAADGVTADRCRRTVRGLLADHHAALDPIGARSRRLCSAEVLLGDAALALDVPRQLATVGPGDVQRAAATLARQRPGVLRVDPTTVRTPQGATA